VRCDAETALERLDEIIAGIAGMFAAESVGESQGFFQLASAHEKTRAVDGPFICSIHFVSPLGGALLRVECESRVSSNSSFSFPLALHVREEVQIKGTFVERYGRMICGAKRTECTRWKTVGQYQKNCATVEFLPEKSL
jgi:hypothetical protein